MTTPLVLTLPGGFELRELKDADARELHALIERNRGQLAEWIQWARDQTPEQTLAFIRRARAKESEKRGLERAIVANGRIAGVVGLPSIDFGNRSAAIGYWLDLEHQGQGLITSAVVALVIHAFDDLRLNRIEIRAAVQNMRSRAVAERLGFRLEGTLRQAYRVGERYSDDAVYSLLASDPRGEIQDVARRTLG